MGMVIGAALAAIAFTVLHHRRFINGAVAMWAGTGLLLHGETPFLVVVQVRRTPTP